MEFLSPTYGILLEVKLGLEAGQSLTEIVPRLLKGPSSPMRDVLSRWWVSKMVGGKINLKDLRLAPLQRHVIETLEDGLLGKSIHFRLSHIEEEMRQVTRDQLERHLQRLPILLLVPLVGLIFPGFLMLLLGPVILQLVETLQ